MENIIKKSLKTNADSNLIYLLKDIKNLLSTDLKLQDIDIVNSQFNKTEKQIVSLHKVDKSLFFYLPKKNKNKTKHIEECRVNADKLQSILKEFQIQEIFIKNIDFKKKEVLAFVEGLVLGNYKFDKYKKKQDKNKFIKSVFVIDEDIEQNDIDELNILVNAVSICKNMVNEPVSYLNSVKLSEEIKSFSEEAGIKVEIYNKAKIEALRMGGLLAVNKGSEDPPTFTIMEWKPKNAKNKKPYILVGKGIVFDTGGMNIKTLSNMDDMKSDMAGAAAVSASIFAIAKNKLPVYVIGLIPSTDNRPSGNAYVPGDVINMYDGTTVEVLNTDAEGRLILADALSYAKKFNPELVIDLATLTGAASIAIGKYGIVAMGQDYADEMKELQDSGDEVYERVVEFPFWEEYGELIKSDVAELKNVGGREAGAITAGKFLAKFTDYPWIHLDIAGPAFVDKRFSYRGYGATAVGVRLLYNFFKNKVKSK